MKRLVIITVILLFVAGYITVTYFKNLSPPGQNTSQVIRNIPGNAALIFEFSNDKSFYEIFHENKLLKALGGKEDLADLEALRTELIQKTILQPFFEEQHIFISVHPSTAEKADFLLTVAVTKAFESHLIEALSHSKGNLLITPRNVAGKKGYTIFIKSLQKRFFLIDKGNNILSGSFSRELADQSAAYKIREDIGYKLLPVQQNTNSLANLYVNTMQLQGLFGQWFKNDTDILRNLSKLPASAVLTLNYKPDALMFSGTTTLNTSLPASYLNIFIKQQATENRLKEIFPSTTAYYISFALSNPARFTADLSDWQKHSPVYKAQPALFKQVKTETGVDIKQSLHQELSKEFAVVSTRFQEKLAIISIKNGSALLPDLMNISSGMSENSGRFNYDRLPLYLLGDAFAIFKRPFFMIIDNYLILANSYQEIESYYDSYLNRKFLLKMDQFNAFDNLMSQRSNVSMYIGLKNTLPVLKRDLHNDTYAKFENDSTGLKDIYGISYQLTVADKDYYTNFCIGLNPEAATAAIDSLK